MPLNTGITRLSGWLLSLIAVLPYGRIRPVEADQQAQKVVLVLHATGRDAEGSVTVDRELRQRLYRHLGGALDYYSEYLDTGRFPGIQQQTAFGQFLRQKYGGRRFDLVITTDNAGLEFLARNRDELFPGTPVLFTDPLDPPAVTLPNSTGIDAAVDFSNSLALAIELQPDTTQVFVVSGAAPSDRVMENRARAQFQRVESRLTFTYLSGLTTTELERRLMALPAHSIVYFLLVYQDGAGETFYPLEYLDKIAPVANRPIYAWIDSAIGHGVVGGRMLRVQSTAADIASLALRVLQGEPAESIPMSTAKPSDVVDWRQLRRWGISEARLPAGTQVLFRELGVWDQYKVYILAAAGLVLAQSGLIGALLFQARKRRRAEARIRDLGSRLLGAQEAERSRIARELHDDISQQATTLAIDLQLLGESSRDQNRNIEELAREAAERTKKMAASIRDLSHRLHPAKLRLLGLVPALGSLQHEFSNSGVSVSFSHQNIPTKLSTDVSLCLFRVVQEALRNAVKHGAARNVSVSLTGTQRTLALAVVDDGVGFTVDAAVDGLGLISMRERLEPIGGTLKIHSKPGGGTRLEISVPLTQVPANETIDVSEELPQSHVSG